MSDTALKYVVVEHMGLEMPIIFPNIFDHDAVAQGCGRVVSAGFCCVDTGNHRSEKTGLAVTCWGRSNNLKVDSRPNQDAALIVKELERYWRDY